MVSSTKERIHAARGAIRRSKDMHIMRLDGSGRLIKWSTEVTIEISTWVKQSKKLKIG